MLKKLLAGLTVFALSLGMVALTAAPASAHQGSITASVVCNPQTGQYDVTYKLSWSAVPDNVHADLYTRTGTTNFSNGWDFGTFNDWYDRGDSVGAAGSTSWVESLPGNTVGNGPWVYAYTAWSNGYDGSTHHDTRIEGLAGTCGATTPGAPTVDPGQCVSLGVPATTGTLNIPSTNSTKVAYYYIVNGTAGTPAGTPPGGSWIPATAGQQIAVAVGQYAHVKVVGINGTVLIGTVKWDILVTGKTAYQCEEGTTPTKPTYTDAVCTAVGDSEATVLIPSGVSGVQYSIRKYVAGDPTLDASWTSWTNATQGVSYSYDNGSRIQVRATILAGYHVNGSWPSGWIGSGDTRYVDKTFTSGPDAVKCVAPTAPTPTYQVCTGPATANQAKYTIPNDDGIQYQIWNGTDWVDVSAGAVNVLSFPTTIKLRAIALSGYTLVGGPYEWTFNFTSAGTCLIDASPTEPDFENARCVDPGTGTTSGYYVVNGTVGDHVVYEVQINGLGWTVVDPSTYGDHVTTAPDDFVEIRATAAYGYKLVGNDLGPWTHTYTNPGDCLDAASAGDPVFKNEICTVDDIGIDDGYYVVIAGTNVYYEVSFDSTDGIDGTWTLVDSSTYGDHVTTSPGDHVWIRAIAFSGYKLADNATHLWDHTFTDAGECLDDTPVKPAIVVDKTCVDGDNGEPSFTSGTITPPTGTPHVTYYVGAVDAPFADAVPLLAETPFEPGDYKVWALADEGYQLVGEGGYVVNDPNARVIKDGQLAYEIVTIGFENLCTLPAITPTVVFVQQGCAAAGTYTLGVEEEDSYQGIVWTITPALSTAQGTHAAPSGLVTITATPADGYGFTGVVPLVNGIPTLTWTNVFALPDDCLPTLALTGGSIASGALGLSALLTLGGILLITARRREMAKLSD